MSFTTVENYRIESPAPDLRVLLRGFILYQFISNFLLKKIVTNLNELNLSINGSNVSRLSVSFQPTGVNQQMHNLLIVSFKNLSEADDTIRWYIWYI